MLRKFSKPVFRLDLVPVFLDTLRALSLSDWVMIRERLYTETADELIDAMVQYKDAFVAREAADKTWYTLRKTYPLDEATTQVYQCVLKARQQDHQRYHTLCELLKGPSYDHEEDWKQTLKLMKKE
jgi:hypothetical protein